MIIKDGTVLRAAVSFNNFFDARQDWLDAEEAEQGYEADTGHCSSPLQDAEDQAWEWKAELYKVAALCDYELREEGQFYDWIGHNVKQGVM